MAVQSAGLLVYRSTEGGIEVFLVHPGGPFFAKRDDGVWSIPKGEVSGIDLLSEAIREFTEETGQTIAGDFHSLGSVRQKSGKEVFAWAVEGEVNAEKIVSNTFTIEWPPHSRHMREFPEVDRAGWFTISQARVKLSPAQAALLDRLLQLTAAV